MNQIQKRNVEGCEHAFEYWKQNKTHSEANRAMCLELATRMMALVKAGAPAAEFLALEQACDQAKIGHGGYGLHSAIIAVLSDLGA